MVIWLEGSVLWDSVGVSAVYLPFNRLCVKQITVMLICKLSNTLKTYNFPFDRNITPSNSSNVVRMLTHVVKHIGVSISVRISISISININISVSVSIRI